MRRRNCPVEMVGSGKVTQQAVLTNMRFPQALGLSVTGLIKPLLWVSIWLALTGTVRSYQTEAFLTGGQGPAPVQSVVQPPATVGFGPTPTPTPAFQGPAVEQSAAPDPWTLEAIQSRLAQLELNTELDPKLKTSLIELYKQIENEVKALADFEKLRRDWTSAAEQAPLAIASAKERLQMSKMAAERAANLPPNSFNLGIELSELERQLQAMQSEMQVVATQRTKADETINQRDKRRKDFPNLLAAFREKIDVFNREQATPPIDNVDPVLREAEVVLKRFQRERVMAELAAMEQEQRAYDAESELWPTRRDEAEQRSNQLQAEIQRLSDVISKRRTLGIELALAEAEMLKEGAPPALHAMADRLLERAQRWLELTRKRASLQEDIASTKSDFEQWNERFQRMDARIKPQSGPDLGGFNSWVGLMLREQRKDLPDPTSLRGQIRKHQNEMQLADSLIFDLEDRRANLLAVQRDRQLLYKEITSDLQNEISDDVLVQTQDMLEKESKILTGMRSEADAYYNDLLQLADGKERLARLSEQYRNFIDQHILWIRSSENLDKSDFRNAWQAFQYFVDYHNWLVVIEFLLTDFKTQPWWYVLVAAGVIALIVYQSSMRRQLIAMQEQVNKRANVSFTPTFKAFLLTVLVSAPFPLLLVFLGMRLLGASSEQTFVTSLGIGLLAGGRFLASLELLRQICRPNGLAIGHLHWPKAGTDLLRTHLRWWLDLGIPLVIGIVVFDELAASRRDESIGRMLFIVLMILLSIFLAQVFRLKGGILSTFLEENRGGWIDRLKLIWYPLMVITPISLAGLSFIGFHYTAERIALSLHTTMWTLVGLIVLHGLLMRWLLLSRRKLTLQQAKLRLEEAAKKDPQAIASSPVEEQVVDIAAINDQTRRLVTSSLFVIALIGVGFIWKSILPAVSLLDSVTLWTVDGVTSDDRVAITLANVVIAIPIVVLTVIASRNLPGLMEIALLQNLPLDKAMRYAITSISSYAILLLGVVVVLASLGLRWSSIQWLVAALGVGLGFGLQEIFANFVCGLIVLFEQPIRVGDVVTIGDTTGMVSRIRMRSTTIVNWDRKELIVPNKDLITGRILNWTLSDGTNRLVMSVGVAYGSDADLVFRLLQDLVKQHPQVLREPEATVTFEAFADSSLTFTIRAFVADVNVRLPTTHELHNSIYRVFAEHNISIAYPQRDLHIRTLPAEFFGQAIKHR
jgi:potassium-dependent mechanosensitive channel